MSPYSFATLRTLVLLGASLVLGGLACWAGVTLDRNRDGISDVWAALYPTAGVPTDDLDGDGQNNLAEAQAGTDPISANSRLDAAAERDAGGNMVVRWFGVAGKQYYIETSADLQNWTPLAGEYAGTGSVLAGVVRAAGTASDARAFWHVVAFDIDSNGNGLNNWEETHLDRVAMIFASAGANGTITPTGNSYVAKGGSLGFAIAPASGYEISQVLVDGQSIAPALTYTFSNIQDAHSIGVTFKPVGTLSVSPTSLSFAAINNATAAVSSTTTWTAASNQAWLTVTPASGTGNATLAVTASANTGTAGRSAAITVAGPAGSGLVQTVTVAQAGGQTSENIALGKPATASGNENQAMPPGFVFDGIGTTRWASPWTDPQWVAVDLGRTYEINKVELVWEAAYGKSYKIQVSTDNRVWSDIYSTTSGAGGTESLAVSGVGRYVRLYGSVRATSYGYSLWECRVYGSPVEAHYLSVGAGSATLGSSGGSATVAVSADVAWSANSDQGWLAVAPASGSGNGTLTLTAGANTAASSRSATIILSGPAGSGLTSSVTLSQDSRTAGLGLLEPEFGMYIGMNADLSGTPAQYNQALGFNAVTHNIYIHIPMDTTGRNWLRQSVTSELANGGFLFVAFNMDNGTDLVLSDAAIDAIATAFAEEEARGAHLMISVKHEMNAQFSGNIRQPVKYRDVYRRIALKIKAKTHNTAMAWVPNVGGGYPWGSDGLPAAGSADFTALDTNHNGAIDAGDDPYEPFYPGDDVVDWVGMDIYWWGNSYPWDSNDMAADRSFANGIQSFYDKYCKAPRNKPMVIMETALFYNPAFGGDELALKRSWFNQVYNVSGDTGHALDVADHFPKLKMVMWFDRNKESDWRLSGNSAVRAAFLQQLALQKNGRKYFLDAAGFRAANP